MLCVNLKFKSQLVFCTRVGIQGIILQKTAALSTRSYRHMHAHACYAMHTVCCQQMRRAECETSLSAVAAMQLQPSR